MLIAHVVPGYFAAAKSRPHWPASWGQLRRGVLWVVAVGATFAPDFDIIYNTVARGAIYHTFVWTHSLFLWLGVGALWAVLAMLRRWPYGRMVLGLAALGGLSHLALDVVAHGTPLFYPLSMQAVGVAPRRVVELGFWAYVTDPIFLLEPVLLGGAAHHWLATRTWSSRLRNVAAIVLWTAIMTTCAAFLLLLPRLQALVSLP